MTDEEKIKAGAFNHVRARANQMVPGKQITWRQWWERKFVDDMLEYSKRPKT